MTTDNPYLVNTSVGYLAITDNETAQETPPRKWNYEGPFNDLTQINAVYYTFLVISIVVIVVGLTGNLMVITVILKHRSMRTTTNYYIFSLATSDLFITAVAMPFKIISLMADSDKVALNNILCSIAEFVMPFFVFTSVWTLVAISLDRYLVIVHPLKSRYFNTKTRAMRNLVIIWTIPFLLFSPYFYPFRVELYRLIGIHGVIQRSICQHTLTKVAPNFEKLYRVFQFLMIFIIPVGMLCFTCGSIAWRLLYYTEDDKMLKNSVRKEEKGRRRVAKMVLVVVFAFTICWLPHYMVSLIAGFTQVFARSNFIFVQVLVYTCGFINSCMNPIIYALMSRAFRKGFWGILTTCCPRYRHLVGGKSQRRDPGHQSMTAVSEGVSHTVTTNHQSRRKPFVRAEMTQVTGASSDADDDDICLKKIDNRPNDEYVNSGNGRPIDNREDHTEKRERLLNKLLDESDDKKGANYPADKSPEIRDTSENNNGKRDSLPVTSTNGEVTSHEQDAVVSSPPLSPTSPTSTSPPGHFETQPLL